MKDNIFPIAAYNKTLNQYLPYQLDYDYVYQSAGLKKHILKRHPECIEYLRFLQYIISHPDYIGVNPNEAGISFELVKTINKHVQIGIKLDAHDNYLYVATLHTITDGKLQHGLQNGRLKKIDKYE